MPLQIRKRISQPDHINVIVHDIISKLQNVQQVAWPSGCKIEESLYDETNQDYFQNAINSINHGDKHFQIYTSWLGK